MSSWLIALTGFIYLAVAVDQIHKGNFPMGLVYIGYAIGNVGFYLALK